MNVRGVVDLPDHVLGNGHHDDRHRRGEIAQRRNAEAGGLQRHVDLAILHELDRFAERKVLDLREVLVLDARRAQHRTRVELGARLRRADRDLLALEVGKRLDAGIGTRDDLDVVRVDRCDAAQLLQR